MFERFTDRARKVMALANQEAQRFQHEYIGTEHILLGLIKEGTGVGAVVLKEFGVDLKGIRNQVELMVKSGPEMVPMGKLPHTPLAKNVIEQAIIASRGLRHNYVGTEHLLLGLLTVPEGVAHKVLTQLGVKPDDVRQRIGAIVGSNPAGAGTVAPGQDMPLSAAVERVLGHARSEARQLGSMQVEQAHLLLAMARSADVTGWILREHGLTCENILALLRHPGRGPTAEVAPPVDE
jgi:ATP-dependent Clp protease ATP-binding subunit ClpC